MPCSTLLKAPPPPIPDGIKAVARWAMRLTVQAARDILTCCDGQRASAVSECVRHLQGMITKAMESEGILRLRKVHTQALYDLACEECPEDACSVWAWSYCQCALVVHRAATELLVWDPGIGARYATAARALSLVARLDLTAEIRSERKRIMDLVMMRRRAGAPCPGS